VSGLEDFARLIPGDHGLCVVSTLRPDATIQSSVVNAGVLAHPVTGNQVVGLVSRGGTRKLANLRERPRASVVIRVGWEWAGIEGPVELAGPDDPLPGVAAERLRLLLREIFTAAGGTHDDWATYDRVMAEERRTAVLVTPARISANRLPVLCLPVHLLPVLGAQFVQDLAEVAEAFPEYVCRHAWQRAGRPCRRLGRPQCLQGRQRRVGACPAVLVRCHLPQLVEALGEVVGAAVDVGSLDIGSLDIGGPRISSVGPGSATVSPRGLGRHDRVVQRGTFGICAEAAGPPCRGGIGTA
jgi:PPOX class probable F420-dependent enzyme